MIQIESLTISEFRGIRNLTLDLHRRNFAVCGSNGTGKSGVVDALEFVLTGTISRLTGKGRGDLSIKEHGPHVDSKKEPEKAFVEANVWIPSLKKSVKVRRTVKAPANVVATPDGPEIQAIFRQLEAHPEIALSRREIIRFVLTEPGQRAKDVQALLKLDDLETLRARLQKISNAAQTTAKSARAERDAAKAEFIRAMGIADASGAEIMEAANKRRLVLGLEPLQTLGSEGSIRDGLATQAGTASATINKAAASADLNAFKLSFEGRLSEGFQQQVTSARAAVMALVADEALLKDVVLDDFLKTAIDLYEGEVCPVCDTPKTLEELGAIINAKRAKLEKVKALRTSAENSVLLVRDVLEAEIALARPVYALGKQLLVQADLDLVGAHGKALTEASATLAALLPLDRTLDCLDGLSPLEPFNDVLDRLRDKVASLPEPSDQDAAREYLITGQLRLEVLRKANAAAKTAEARAGKAQKVFEIYSETSTAALEKVYADVQGRFAELYRQINADDEGAFEAKLKPSLGKLGFGVDFYGRGFFPPGAYHSEGHQDSMGLCLYLALMGYLLGAGFTFAVLDDVLMSVDAGHRREVSKLLKTEFPNTQFVLTTHDRAWQKFMSTTGLVEGKDTVQFRKWTVDEGPTAWSKGDIWDEMREKANLDDIAGAAGSLRRGLEHLSGEVCQSLRAKVEFSVDGQHDLGDLLDPAIGQMKFLYKEARLAAESWGDSETVTEVKAREAAFAAAVAAAKVEQWQMNPAVHYNAWANLQQLEMIAVIDAFQALFDLFNCDRCNALIEVSPGRGRREYMQCMCSKVKLSFTSKPKVKEVEVG
jgi:hypothetical protein